MASRPLNMLPLMPLAICRLRRGLPALDSISIRYSAVPGFAPLDISLLMYQCKALITSECSFMSITVSFIVNLPFCGVYCTYFLPSIVSHCSNDGEPFGFSYHEPVCQSDIFTSSPDFSIVPAIISLSGLPPARIVYLPGGTFQPLSQTAKQRSPRLKQISLLSPGCRKTLVKRFNSLTGRCIPSYGGAT